MFQPLVDNVLMLVIQRIDSFHVILVFISWMCFPQYISFSEFICYTVRFLWGVGTKAGSDDVVKFRNLTQYDKSGCAPAALDHNRTYYSTVFAYNNALNSKATNGSSDGGRVIVLHMISSQYFVDIYINIILLKLCLSFDRYFSFSHKYIDTCLFMIIF